MLSDKFLLPGAGKFKLLIYLCSPELIEFLGKALYTSLIRYGRFFLFLPHAVIDLLNPLSRDVISEVTHDNLP
jgi:hypothetical protein